MTVLERNMEQALRSAEGVRWMRGYLEGLLADGEMDRATLIDMLQSVHDRFREEGEDGPADMCLDGLDLLTGWHGPGMGVPDRQPA